MAIIELTSYHLPPENGAGLLEPFDFTLSAGDVCAVQTDSADLGHLFLKALAMIRMPLSGEYRCDGALLSRRHYSHWLRYRRRISYIGPVSALISNLSIRENLLLSRYYYENDLNLEVSPEAARMCHATGLASKLSSRPGEINPQDRRLAIAIRELTRDTSLIILDNPEDLMGHTASYLLMGQLQRLHRQGVPVVIMSEGENPVRQMVSRSVTIIGGRLREEATSVAEQIEALR